MRSRLTLGVRCLPIIPCTAGRIRTRGTPLARKLPAVPYAYVTWRDHARARKTAKHPFGVTKPHSRLIRRKQRTHACEIPLQTARGISIIAMQLSPSEHSDVLDFHVGTFFHLNISTVKNKAIASNPERSANALILMRLLYNKVAVLSSDARRASSPVRSVLRAKLPFIICSHIHIFCFFGHATSDA